jgi:hypothetical protein
MKFVGMQCALEALAFSIEEQLDKNNCVCAACSMAFETLYRNCAKDGEPGVIPRLMKKRLDRYWANLEKRNKRVKP